ncbi:MAG: hypothetical protein KKG14_02195 [Alphaproteobacteria bacterium]|nr:hypothetical protein [Alphaproteobacteria bacterium]MBU2417494.1 hypothetical protein [Alphaproteobacteria bacterium]
MRKTALLTGVAGLFLLSAPAMAQDGTSPQTPPATPPAATTEAPAPEAPTLSLQPGMTVRGADGELGVLVGARTHAGAQQLTVQGADGSVRAVPIDGIRQDGEDVVVDFTVEQYAAAETVTPVAATADPAADTMAQPEPAPDAVAPPAAPAQPGMTPAVPEPTVAPPAPPPPTLPPETPAAPVPGEGQDDPTDPMG